MVQSDIMQMDMDKLEALRRQLIAVLVQVEDLLEIPDSKRACRTRRKRRTNE